MGKVDRIDLEKVPDFVHPGDRLWIGGWTLVRKPMAMVYQIIKAAKRDLHVMNNPGGPDTDLLIGAGCVSKTETSYIGHEVFGHPHNFKRKLEKGHKKNGFRHDDWTVGSGTMRIVAGAMGIPFIPTRFLRGSDMLQPEHDGFKEIRGTDSKVPRKKFAVIKDPFWEGEDVVLVPALRPDVCLLHAQQVSENGTVRISGGAFLDYYAAAASKVTIVSTEKIVPAAQFEKTREENTIPAELVNAVVEVPFGGHPSAVHDCYDNDPLWFKHYIQASKESASMSQWLDEWIYGVPSFDRYLDKIGTRRLNQLVADPDCGYAPNILRRLDKL